MAPHIFTAPAQTPSLAAAHCCSSASSTTLLRSAPSLTTTTTSSVCCSSSAAAASSSHLASRTSTMLSIPPLSPRRLLSRLSEGARKSSDRLVAHATPAQTQQLDTSTQLLLDYITSGPLLEPCGLTPERVEKELAMWVDLGTRVCDTLGFPAIDQLDDVQRLRVFHYYLPVFVWVQDQLAAHRAAHAAATQPPPPLVLGVSAPQGCGKTTLSEALVDLFSYVGQTAASVSIDDFYLTNADQRALAAANPSNRLLELRGNAGSHDLALGTATLRALTTRGAGEAVALPRYDKSAFSGRGDRAPEAAWPSVTLPVDVVLFEGWMLGFRPVDDAAAAAVDASLAPVNDALRAYGEAWDSYCDAWLVVRVTDPRYVYRWRAQAEEKMRAGGKPGMTDDEVRDFVDRYMPAYRAYLPSLYERGPTTARPGKLLVVEVDEHRAPLMQQPAKIM